MISDLVSLPCLFLPFSKKKDEKGWRDIIVFRRKTMVGSKGSNHGSISLLTCPAVFVRDPTIVRSPFGRSNHEPFILLLLIKDENKILYNIRDKSKCIKRRIFFLFLEGYIRKGKNTRIIYNLYRKMRNDLWPGIPSLPFFFFKKKRWKGMKGDNDCNKI